MMETIIPFVEKQSFTIASQIAFFRKYRGLSQAKLGKLCGMKQSSIVRLENTPDTAWKATTLNRLAAALKVRVSVDLIAIVRMP